jgi:hypothetical protein
MECVSQGGEANNIIPLCSLYQFLEYTNEKQFQTMTSKQINIHLFLELKSYSVRLTRANKQFHYVRAVIKDPSSKP